jgi:hypothetical protein
MSRSIHALVSKKATNKEVLFNGRLTNFVSPPIHTGDLYITRDLRVGRDTYLKNLDISGNLTVSGDSSLASTDISGNLTVSGTISPDKYIAGQVIRTFIYSNTDLNQSALTIGNGVTSTLFTISYTPVSSTSYIFIEYQTSYSLNGSNTDIIYAYLNVGLIRISQSYQKWIGDAGGGTRSGTIFPIVGRYTNTDKTPKQIRVDSYNGTDSDTLTIDSDISTWLKITEVGR